MVVMCGSTTVWVIEAASAASHALPPLFQDLDGGPGRERMRGDRHPAGSFGRRLLAEVGEFDEASGALRRRGPRARPPRAMREARRRRGRPRSLQ